MRNEMDVDSVIAMMQKSACNFAYKGFYNLGTQTLNETFNLYVAERDLRSNESLMAKVPKCRIQFVERNFAYRGVRHWNYLPLEIKSALLLMLSKKD